MLAFSHWIAVMRRPQAIMTGIALAALAAVVFMVQTEVFDQNAVHQSAANQLISQAGEFRSPTGSLALFIVRASDQPTVVVKVRNLREQQSSAGGEWQIPVASSWFYCFGHNNKLWGYAVDIGPHSWEVSAEGCGFTRIGTHGGWQNVPAEFLAALPREQRAIYEKWKQAQPHSI